MALAPEETIIKTLIGICCSYLINLVTAVVILTILHIQLSNAALISGSISVYIHIQSKIGIMDCTLCSISTWKTIND